MLKLLATSMLAGGGRNGHLIASIRSIPPSRQNLSLVDAITSNSIASTSTPNFIPQTASGQPSSDADLSQNQGFFIIAGQVTNGSGGDLKDLGKITLVVANGGETLQEMTSTLTADGQFNFFQVPYHPSWNYIAEVVYEGIVYKSPRLFGLNFSSTQTIPLTIKVYDAISDISALQGERLHALVNIKPDGTIHVTETLLFSNPLPFTISSTNAQDPLLKFKIGSNASGVTFNSFDQTQNLKIVNGVLGDWESILPGSVHQVMFEYDLPFNGDQTIDFNTPLPVASAIVMVERQSNDIACVGMQLSNQTFGSSAPVIMYTGVNISADGNLALHCFDKKTIFPEAIGIAVLIITLLAVMWVAIASKRNAQKENSKNGNRADKNSLLDAIITLDDQFKAGEISAEAYHTKREEFIKKLEGG